MRDATPIFREKKSTYYIDTCQSQLRAAQEGQIRLVGLSHGLYPGTVLMPDHLPGLSSAGFVDAVGDQNWRMAMHRNEGIEFTHLETGSLPFCVDDCQYILEPGDITITRPWQLHGSGANNWAPGMLNWVILDVGVRRPNQKWQWPKWLVLSEENLSELTSLLRECERPVWPGNGDLTRCFRRISAGIKAEKPSDRLSRLALHVNELLLLLIELLRGHEIVRNPSLKSNRRTVELFLKDLDDSDTSLMHEWTLPEMANHCNLSVTAFIQIVRLTTNMTPMSYLKRRRLARAARWLVESPQDSVTDIAIGLGFGSSQYFATCFRHEYHVTPTEWRVLQSESDSTPAKPDISHS